MKKLLVLFVFLAATGLYSQTPNYPYTTLIVPQVLIPGSCTGKVVAADGTGCVEGGGSGTVSDGAGTTTAGLQGVSTGAAHVISYVPQFAVDITQPPYNAKCDGVTDDHVAIQAALDNNRAITIPISLTPSLGTVCNIGTVGITLNQPGNAIYGNGQFFAYSGSGIAVEMYSTSAQFDQNQLVNGLDIDMTGSTGTPTAFDINYSGSILENSGDFGGPTGYYSIAITGDQNHVRNHDGSGRLHVTGFEAVVDSSGFGLGPATGVGVSDLSCRQCSLHGVTILGFLTIGLTTPGAGTFSSTVLDSVYTNAITYGTYAGSVQGTVDFPTGAPGTITGTPKSGVVTYGTGVASAQTVIYGPAQILGITGIGSTGALCVDTAGNIAVSTNNTGVGAPCP